MKALMMLCILTVPDDLSGGHLWTMVPHRTTSPVVFERLRDNEYIWHNGQNMYPVQRVNRFEFIAHNQGYREYWKWNFETMSFEKPSAVATYTNYLELGRPTWLSRMLKKD